VAQAREGGAQVVVGRSFPYGESSAYDGFAQQIKQIAGVLGGDPPDLAAEKLRTTIGELVDDDSAEEVAAHIALMLGLQSSDETVSDRHVLFFSVQRVVQALADARPTVLVFQDLHWADPSLLDLIEMLAARVERAPLLLLTAARPELQAKRPAWGAHGQASVGLGLEPLDPEDARELAGRLLVRAAGSGLGTTADDISDLGEGNPLFIEELVASLAERSALVGQGLPTSIRGIIAARLDAVPPAERSALLSASVVGRVFWDGALARLIPDPERVSELLQSLEDRDLVRREPASRFHGYQQFRFKHALIRDVAYAALPRATRRDAHAAVAAFLEELQAERQAPAGVGHHWLQAGNPERALGYLVAAADQASSGWAKEEAVTLYRQAAELIGEDDPVRRREVRLKLALAQQMLFHLRLSDAGPAL
jgi:predicted ATPase